MKTLLTQFLIWPAAVAVVALSNAGPVQAQQTIATGDGLIELRASMPNETRAGEQFTYTIEVQNTSDNVSLHDIQLEQQKVKGFSIEDVQLGSDTQNAKRRQNIASNANRRNANRQSSQRGQSENAQRPRNAQRRGNRGNQDGSQQSDGKQSDGKQSDGGQAKGSGQQQASTGQPSGKQRLTIAKLDPGQSKTITVKASADEEGQLQTCLEVISYRPAICLTSQVVKPDLEIVKDAPDQVGRCEMIELYYTVKNGGSGSIGTFQVVDELGEDLATIEGENTLKFDVDGLRAGETREFVARVYARKPGEFSSRAVAEAKNSDLKARSKKTTTKVIAADLDVAVDGPSRLYGDQLAQFTAHVTNTGNTSAENVRVQVHYPSDSGLADLSEPRMGKNQRSGNSSSSRNGNDQSPTPAAMETASQQAGSSNNNRNRQQREQRDRDVNMSSEELTLARLEPGQTATFEYAIRPRDLSEIPTQVKATYVCTVEQAADRAQAQSETTSMDRATVSIVRLPALQLVVLDDEDPVMNSKNVTYTIRVWNEGDSADSQVALETELPQGLKFVSANGPTEHKIDGSTISFQPVESLEAGDHVDYKVTAKSTGSGNVRFTAKVSSEALEEEVIGEEPTRLFSGQARN